MKSSVALPLLLAACGPDAGMTFGASWFILVTAEEQTGQGILLLSDLELECGELTTTTDWNATLYGANALYISLIWSYPESPGPDPWVATFGADVHDTDGATFHASAWWYRDDGLILQDDSGLLVEIEQYSLDGVTGTYEHIWSADSFDAEHCGKISPS